MGSFGEIIQQGSAHAWLFIPSAILLGALHGLEPGHSKTMMAAFIVAVRGTVPQAVLLGLSAALSHTAVVWAVALVGLHYAGRFDAETSEPYFQLLSAVIIVGVAAFMLWRSWRDAQGGHEHAHDHGHGHGHGHHAHAEAVRRIDTGHGVAALEVFEDGVPPRWRLRFEGAPAWAAAGVSLETIRPGGARQSFAFADRGGYLESLQEVPEPHAFDARLRLAHGGHAHEYALAFEEHGHDHGALPAAEAGYQDAHARAHAEDIRRRFTGREVTTGQIVLFGLTGGLIPCPAAITVLMLCLQLREFSLGVALVLCFSAGLAAVMVAVGVGAAYGMRHAERRWSGAFEAVTRRAPLVSAGVILLVGLYMGWHAWAGLARAGA
ncbi:nickel/cobalt efflux transporter RcnA [Roseomonas nepalensis]|uniref:Nickel/cobalt efflux system n=1 Tax=Muricoccus nepalensis TaxID=1854500 RepID=A0A502G2B2_9PROT|nr:nickel/cobalt efflux transporter [Roseomonas nepalensis]TPG55690.1 nickel/cobalt efflux transporter RcnA [Roseomonas nepalensis]